MKTESGFVMTNDARGSEDSSGDVALRTGSAGARTATGSLIRDLEQLRALVLDRLASIERLVCEHNESVPPARDLSALEASVQKKSAELEEALRVHHARAEQERHDWIAAMSQLEDDRRLLAEAWERIEQERIDALSAPRESASVHSTRKPPTGAFCAVSPNAGSMNPGRSARAESELRNPVAQAILQQFQTLCGDVRQNARRSSR